MRTYLFAPALIVLCLLPACGGANRQSAPSKSSDTAALDAEDEEEIEEVEVGEDEDCGNGDDDDFDGLADCRDDDCLGSSECQEDCDNGDDDDLDGVADCADDDCAGRCSEDCDNGRDDDGDGDEDCDDAECKVFDTCVELVCDDGQDSDDDGDVDCDDSDCASSPACTCPTHDDLSGALGSWSVADGAVDQDVLDPATCGSASSGDELILEWTAPYQGCFQVNTEGSTYDTVAYVLAGDDCDGSEIACDDDSGPDRTSSVRWWGDAGDDFLLVLDAFSDSESGSLVVQIDGLPGGAEADLDVGTSSGGEVVTGNTAGEGADTSFGSCSSRSGAPDVVVEWTVPASGTWQIDTNESDFDTIISVIQNCVELTCDDDSGDGSASMSIVELETGDLVQIVITGYNGAEGNYALNLTYGG